MMTCVMLLNARKSLATGWHW